MFVQIRSWWLSIQPWTWVNAAYLTLPVSLCWSMCNNHMVAFSPASLFWISMQWFRLRNISTIVPIIHYEKCLTVSLHLRKSVPVTRFYWRHWTSSTCGAWFSHSSQRVLVIYSCTVDTMAVWLHLAPTTLSIIFTYKNVFPRRCYQQCGR